MTRVFPTPSTKGVSLGFSKPMPFSEDLSKSFALDFFKSWLLSKTFPNPCCSWVALGLFQALAKGGSGFLGWPSFPTSFTPPLAALAAGSSEPEEPMPTLFNLFWMDSVAPLLGLFQSLQVPQEVVRVTWVCIFQCRPLQVLPGLLPFLICSPRTKGPPFLVVGTLWWLHVFSKTKLAKL